MSIKFKCGLCDHKMKAGEKYIGRKIDCPNCGGSIEVPKQTGKKAPVSFTDEDDVEFFDEDDEAFETAKFSTPKTSKLKKPATTGERVERVRGKKPSGKKKEEDKTPSWVLVGVICGSLMMFLMMGVGIFMFGGSFASGLDKMGQVKAPETFEHFHHEHWVGIDYPTGFKVTSGGGTGGLPAWIKIEGEGGVQMQVREDHAAEAIGDIAQASPAGPIVVDGALPVNAGPSDLDPVASVHSFLKLKVEPEYSGYEEQPMVPAKAKMGDARYSEFTASGMVGKTYGLRGTVLAGPNAVKIIATCSKRQYEAYKPVFVKMLESVGNN